MTTARRAASMSLITPGGRRDWIEEAKGRIVLEGHAPGAHVADVARRHRIAPQQATTWRRDAREGKLALPVDDEAEFALLTLEKSAASSPSPVPGLAVEIEQDGDFIRLPADTPPERIAAVAAALRRAR